MTKAWRKNNPEKNKANNLRGNKRKLELHPEKYKELNRKYSKEWACNHPEERLHAAARQRANQNNIPFDIKRSDIVIPTHCPLLGLSLQRSGSGRVEYNSPSLDRIHNNRGYVKGNIWVISHRANRLKSNATLEELELLTTNLRKALSRQEDG